MTKGVSDGFDRDEQSRREAIEAGELLLREELERIADEAFAEQAKGDAVQPHALRERVAAVGKLFDVPDHPALKMFTASVMHELENGSRETALEYAGAIEALIPPSPAALARRADREAARTLETDRAAAQEHGAMVLSDFRNAVLDVYDEAQQQGDKGRVDRAMRVIVGVDAMQHTGLKEVTLPTGVLGVDRENLSLSDVERVLVGNAERLYAERLRALREAKKTVDLAAEIGKTIGNALPDEYTQNLTEAVWSLYIGESADALEALSAQGSYPNAEQFYRAFSEVPPPAALAHPALVGLASALHDIGVENLTDTKVEYLAKATEDLLRTPVATELSEAQTARVHESLSKHGSLGTLQVVNDQRAVPAPELVQYYMRTGAAVLDRAQELANADLLRTRGENFDAWRIVDAWLDTMHVQHSRDFGSELEAVFERAGSGEPRDRGQDRRQGDRRAQEREAERDRTDSERDRDDDRHDTPELPDDSIGLE